MERKLVRQGRNALTVTLPSTWLKERGLSVGDSVQIDGHNKDLIIGAGMRAKKKEISLNLKDTNWKLVYHTLIGVYIEGYDRIILHYSLPEKSQEIVNSLLGMVIEESTPTQLILKSIISVPEEDFDILLRRAAHMLVEQANLIVELTKEKANPAQVKMQERLLDITLLYCLRFLSKYESVEDSKRYFLLCATLEAAGDHLSQIAGHIGRRTRLAEQIARFMQDYTSAVFESSLEKAYYAMDRFRAGLDSKTFLDGLLFALVEEIHNYLGYIVRIKERS